MKEGRNEGGRKESFVRNTYTHTQYPGTLTQQHSVPRNTATLSTQEHTATLSTQEHSNTQYPGTHSNTQYPATYSNTQYPGTHTHTATIKTQAWNHSALQHSNTKKEAPKHFQTHEQRNTISYTRHSKTCVR